MSSLTTSQAFWRAFWWVISGRLIAWGMSTMPEHSAATEEDCVSLLRNMLEDMKADEAAWKLGQSQSTR